MKQRAISDAMMQSLLSGELRPVLEAVREDDTLCLELRGTGVNLYYRGGSLFRIEEQSQGYVFTFDTHYCDDRSKALAAHPSASQAVAQMPYYKQAMDRWFHRNPKYEREFQQLILRENNRLAGALSKSTDYYIVDMEYAEPGARFDIVAIKWLSKSAERKNPAKPTLALMEVKYGDGALRGDAGIQKHLTDLSAFLRDHQQLKEFCKDMSKVFRQKCELGLMEGLAEKQYQVEIGTEDAEVVFIFANHDPDSKVLMEELSQVNVGDYDFPIKVAAASMMGYGLYADKFVDLKELQ